MHFRLISLISKHEHSSLNHGLCCFNSYKKRLFLAEDFILLLMFSQALFMSSLSRKFSKAANLFEISIWLSFLYTSSFSFLRIKSTYCQSLPNIYNYQIVISITVRSPKRQYFEYKKAISYLLLCEQYGCDSAH